MLARVACLPVTFVPQTFISGKNAEKIIEHKSML
jgi:hypothetical protein